MITLYNYYSLHFNHFTFYLDAPTYLDPAMIINILNHHDQDIKALKKAVADLKTSAQDIKTLKKTVADLTTNVDKVSCF